VSPDAAQQPEEGETMVDHEREAASKIAEQMEAGTIYGRAFAKLISHMERFATARAARCGRSEWNADDLRYARRVFSRRRDKVAALWVPTD
jgi:hypothetical protein